MEALHWNWSGEHVLSAVAKRQNVRVKVIAVIIQKESYICRNNLNVRVIIKIYCDVRTSEVL